MPTRSDQARVEMTRDPIFLLQRAIGNQWHIESVWLTREEAEDYGRANAHNLRPLWRVYCVPAGGELARTLARINPIYQSEPAPAGGESRDERLLSKSSAPLG